MKRNQLIGGILFLVAGAITFMAMETDSSVPIALALATVGVALIAVSRRRPRSL